MTVLVTDATVRTVDNQFGLLVASDVSRRINGLLLRVVHGGCLLIPGTLYSPTVFVWNYMLIFSCHGEFPS